MTRTYTETVTLQEVTCGECGITYAVPQRWLEEKQETGKGFHCPNGHGRCYRETETMRISKQLKDEQKHREQLELQLTSVRDQLHAAEREAQRHKKRVANGVCPCCNRSFQQLQRHMKTKHPDYAKEKQVN
jgi:outer membrane murein-binding lipoprotein Lpp